jgi:hypothetical protein
MAINFSNSILFIPVLALGFLLLLSINFLTQYKIRKNEQLKRLNFYLLVALTISLLPILAFVIFDYLHRGRYFEEKTFMSIFLEYSPLLVWAGLVIFLNWRFVIKKLNFG